MALDKLVDSTQLDSNLTSVANAIRAKSGGTGQLAFPAGFVSEIGNISGGGGEWTSDGIAKGTEPNGDIILSNAVTKIVPGAFFGSKISKLIAPSVTYVGVATNRATESRAICSCPNLETIFLPECLTAYGMNNFNSVGSSSHPVTIVLPKITTVGNQGFRGTYAAAIDFGPRFSALPDYSFYIGTFQILIFRKTDGVVTVPSANAIRYINASTKVYVPSALIESYKAATQWSTKGSIFYPIEGSIYETQYADGTPISAT